MYFVIKTQSINVLVYLFQFQDMNTIKLITQYKICIPYFKHGTLKKREIKSAALFIYFGFEKITKIKPITHYKICSHNLKTVH